MHSGYAEIVVVEHAALRMAPRHRLTASGSKSFVQPARSTVPSASGRTPSRQAPADTYVFFAPTRLQVWAWSHIACASLPTTAAPGAPVVLPSRRGGGVSDLSGRFAWGSIGIGKPLPGVPVGRSVPASVARIETGGERLFNIDRSGGQAGSGALSRGADIVIPPNGYRVLQGVTVLDAPTVVYSFRPHMHARGKEMSMEAIYPDGRRETLIKTNNYRHNWQIAYQFADDARPLLPQGTVLLFTSVFDNTEANPLNPDPNQWVVFGRGGVHEMSNVWVGLTSLTDQQYQSLLAERGRPIASLERQEQRMQSDPLPETQTVHLPLGGVR